VAVKPLLHHALDLVFGPDDPRIVWQVPADIPPVMVDEIYTEQVVRNLLRNAQKYAPPQSPIELSVAVEAQRLCIGVTDHGPGIPAGQQTRVFERFARLSQGKGDRPPGWGLGLYFARALMEAQGGTLTLHSPVHADPAAPGSRFLICLPIAQEILAEETAAVAADAAPNGAVVSGSVANGQTLAGR
jgi:two-component system sensor histidine kinase KdpD